ncbi:TRAP transporter small permease [Pollutimonas thiosulfatoxidans]|uniref:TRAP transporter small permease protein n=1 Tax=Pollutimonas thiosulfatoxidans TaxID=2028345 RepID=A0A410GG46_9BURK|nr:TRAP transporter small permease [Pollutimonas thiosulfatoxidans]NYT45469.1 TRAP transporter small permease [Alcaligenaceae bacterium]QAA95261.1 hypothetical protein CKA81_16370 [Pollutimonas thiosulfatoxidans]
MSSHTPTPQSGAISRALDVLCRFFERVAIAMLLITTFLVVLQVFGRNLFLAGLPWADELARYGGLGIVYLAIPLLLLHDKHIAVDIISSRLRGGPRYALQVLSEAIIVLFSGFFMVAGYEFLSRAGKFTTPALSMPNLVFYLPTTIGMVLFAAVAVQRLWRAVNRRPVVNSGQESTS